MLKLFVTAAELALPLCLLSAVLIANRSYAPRYRQRVGRLTVASLVLGALTSVVIVWLRLNTRLIRLPMINLWGGVFQLLALVGFLVTLWLMGRRPLVTDEIGWRNRLLNLASWGSLFLVNLMYGIPLYLAIDLVVPMGGVLFASDSLVNLLGYFLGMAVAVTAGLVVGISLNRMPNLFRQVLSTLFVGIAVSTQWPALYQQFSTAKILPKSSLNFQLLLWVQRHNLQILLIFVGLLVTTAVVAYLVRPRTVPEDSSLAEHRILKAEGISRRRMLALSLGVGSALVLTYTVGRRAADAVPELSPIEPSVVNGEHVEVALDLVTDGHLHRFAYESKNGTQVRFIVIQKNPTSFGTGLDACEICGPSGYYERDGKVVCRECDVIMNTQTIGFPGGCNPIPIQYEIAPSKLLFQVAELEQQAKVFR